MPIRKVSLLLFSLIAACLLTAESVNAEFVRVSLLGGQSNMAGRAHLAGLPTSPVNLQLPQDDILFYYGRSLTTLRPGSGRNFGPEVTFGRTVADAFPTEKFAIIKYARGGTSLSSDWEPVTGSTYSIFRKTVKKGFSELKHAGRTYKVVGMLWTQGERDAKADRTTKQYETDLNGFIADIRNHYGAELPFFISRLSRGQTDITESGLKKIGSRHPGFQKGCASFGEHLEHCMASRMGDAGGGEARVPDRRERNGRDRAGRMKQVTQRERRAARTAKRWPASRSKNDDRLSADGARAMR